MSKLWTGERVAALPSWSVIRTHLLLAPRLARTLAPVGLSPTQFGVLVQLGNTPGATSSELARACLMTPQSMSELLPGLESAGHVERATSGRGRPAPVHLTDAGRGVLARATPLVEEADRAEALGLDPRRADHSRASLVGKRTRQPLVFAHVVVSLGWMGAGAANVVLTSTAAVTDDVELRRACYLLVATIDRWLVIPGAFLALATGVVLSLVTPWGLVTYWWVLVKLALTVGVILYSTFFVGEWVEESVAVGISPSPVAVPLVIGPLVRMAAFLLMTWASVAKPWGRTPWRRRRARERVLAAA